MVVVAVAAVVVGSSDTGSSIICASDNNVTGNIINKNFTCMFQDDAVDCNSTASPPEGQRGGIILD